MPGLKKGKKKDPKEVSEAEIETVKNFFKNSKNPEELQTKFLSHVGRPFLKGNVTFEQVLSVYTALLVVFKKFCVDGGECRRYGVGAEILGAEIHSACVKLLTPVKTLPGKKLTLLGKRYNALLNIVRSPVERCFSRMHKWGTIKFSIFSPKTTNKMVNIIARLERQFFPAAKTERIVQVPSSCRASTTTKVRKDLLEELRAHPESFDLRTKASTNAKRGAPKFKRHENEDRRVRSYGPRVEA